MKNDFEKHLKLFKNLNVFFWIGGACIYDFFNGHKPIIKKTTKNNKPKLLLEL